MKSRRNILILVGLAVLVMLILRMYQANIHPQHHLKRTTGIRFGGGSTEKWATSAGLDPAYFWKVRASAGEIARLEAELRRLGEAPVASFRL